MALEVGELVAFLRLEDQDFQTKLRRNGVDMRSFGQNAQKVLQPVATAFAGSATSAGVLLSAVVAQGAAYNKLQQTSRAALTTILGGAEAANEQMDKLDDFAQNSPFSRSTFITAQQQMLAFGIETEKVIPYLGAIQDGVAAMGGSNQEISELAFIMAQISAAGKITGQDLMQFGQRGVNAAKLIGDEMGMTEAEIRDSITKGTLDAGEALDALAAGMQTTYDGAAANVKNTMDGAVDRVKAASRDIGSILAAPFIDPQGGGKALDWANGLADLLRAVEGQADTLVTALLPQLLPLADGITRHLERATSAVEGLDMRQLLSQIGALSEYATPVAAVAAGLFAMGTQAGPLTALGLSINPVAAALLAVVATSEDARGAALALLDALSPLTDEFGELLKAGGDLFNTVLSGLSGLLLEVAYGASETGGAVDLLAYGIETLTSTVRFVNDVIGPLIGWLTDAASAASGFEGPILGVVAALILLRGINLSGILSGLTGALQAAKPQWEASRGVLESLGREAGTMNTAMMTARAGATHLGGALKGLMVANAPMLAVTALAAVIGHFAQESAKAKAQADQLIDTFDELTGAATVETDKMILTQLNEQISSGDWAVLKDLGYSYQEIVDIVKEGGPALAEFTEQVRISALSETQLTKESREREAALTSLKMGLDSTGAAYGTAADQAAELAQQNAAVAGSTDEVEVALSSTEQAAKDFGDALAVISDEASSADEKLRALQSIMDIIAGKAVSAADASFSYAGTVRDAAAAVEELALSQEELDGILTDDGSLNVQSEAAGKLREEFRGLSDDANTWAIALAEAGDSQGVRDVYQGLYEDIQALAEAAGLGAEETNALMLSLGILPPEVMTDIVVNGTESELDINRVGYALNDLPAEVVSAIYGDTSGLDTAVDHTGLQLAYVAGMSADPTIGADDKENARIVSAATARLIELDGMEPTPEILAEKGILERVVADAKVDLDSIPDKDLEIIAKTFGFDSVAALRAEIERTKSKTVELRTRYITSGSPPRHTGRGGPVAFAAQADGSVLNAPKFFANGSENHVAQIAPAGAWRVWAEEETGGEAYVPLSPAKRARSLAIMHDVASRFGHVMVPVNAQRYADGGTTVRPVTTSVTQGPSLGEMEAAFTAAMATMRPVVQIADREFVGVMRRAERMAAR